MTRYQVISMDDLLQARHAMKLHKEAMWGASVPDADALDRAYKTIDEAIEYQASLHPLLRCRVIRK